MACVQQPLAWVSVIAAAVAAVPSTSREPVLKQIRLPHAYYYREMYVPQVTSGPTERHLVTRRTRADLLHAGVALAAAHRLD